MLRLGHSVFRYSLSGVNSCSFQQTPKTRRGIHLDYVWFIPDGDYVDTGDFHANCLCRPNRRLVLYLRKFVCCAVPAHVDVTSPLVWGSLAFHGSYDLLAGDKYANIFTGVWQILLQTDHLLKFGERVDYRSSFLYIPDKHDTYALSSVQKFHNNRGRQVFG